GKQRHGQAGDEGAGVEDGAHVDRRPVDAGAFEEHRRKRHGDQGQDRGTCVGGDTLAAVAQLGADLFFLGSCGLDASRGVTAFDSAEAEVKRAMARNSAGIVIAVTNDKLATAAPYRVAAPDAISHLVVDKTAPSAILADFERLGVEIHFA
ncbi:MAG: DeoR/GlpR transcriptional regulator, partial [Mesorhizobium sp.]